MARALLALLLLGVIAPYGALALRVMPQAIRSLPQQELSETERLEREWTISADATDRRPLESIVAGVACQVYVSYSPASRAVATVRVVGDNAAIMEKTVVVSSSPGELRLHAPTIHASTAHEPVEIEGYVRVEILVHDGALIHSIQASGSGDVVVDNHVLMASDPSLNLTAFASSSGDLYLPPRLQVNANTLQLHTSGSGSIHTVAGTVVVNDVEIRVGGSGGVQFGADSLQAARSVSVAASGSGSTDMFFTMVRSAQLVVTNSGSGDVKVARDTTSDGSEHDLDQCAMKASGGGDIQTDSVVCTTAQAVASGSGDIAIAVRQSLTCKAYGSGEVMARTIEPTPAKPTGCRVRAPHNTIVAETPPAWVYAYSLPSRKSSRTTMVYGGERPGLLDGNDGDTDEDDQDREKDETNEDSPRSAQYTYLWKPVLVVVLSITVLALWQRHNASRDRSHQRLNEKTALLSEDAPVYI